MSIMMSDDDYERLEEKYHQAEMTISILREQNTELQRQVRVLHDGLKQHAALIANMRAQWAATVPLLNEFGDLPEPYGQDLLERFHAWKALYDTTPSSELPYGEAP